MRSPIDHDTLRLNDGRTLAYRHDPTRGKRHAVWFDGTPGSRLADPFGAQTRAKLDLDLVTFDRPGYGDSDRHPGRTVADIAGDVAQLTAHLGWNDWIAIGYSGGGPHALACGARLADEVNAAIAVATVAPPHEIADWADWAPDAGAVLSAITHAPEQFEAALAEMAAAMSADPIPALLAAFGDGGTPADAAFLTSPRRRRNLDATLREALEPGHLGWFDDEVALHRPWGFNLGEIAVRTHFLHGIEDPIAPIQLQRRMVALVSTATSDEIADVGHLAILDHLHRLTDVLPASARTRTIKEPNPSRR